MKQEGREDYFQLMGLPRRMALDSKALDETFYTLSRKFHPDFYQNSSEEEKQLSLERTALLNNAYQTLKDPIQRIEYLLDLEAPVPERERHKTSLCLLQEVFDIQEVVEAYRQAAAADDQKGAASLKGKVENAAQEVLAKIERRRKALEDSCREWDRLVADPPSPATLQEEKSRQAQKIRAILDELTYLKTLLQSIQTGALGRS